MREIHRILCPVDLSDVSNHAVSCAVLIAGWYESSISALHICNPIVIPTTDLTLVGAGPPPVLTEREIQELREQIAAVFAAAGAAHVDVIIGSGPPAKKILELARSLPADLIVIGTHGSSGFEHLVPDR